MFGPGRRIARRTARRTTRRQMMIQEAKAPPPQALPQQPAMPVASAQPDYTVELQELAKMKEQGILTDAEFQAKKKQILGI